MKSFPDPTLTVISRKLRDLDFESDSTLDFAAESITTLRNVNQFPANKKKPGAPRDYVVVLFVAQKLRVIGRTHWKAAACRFADMAKMRFYKFKQRGAVEPTDADLNFSVAQAKSDLQFETSAVALLDEIEAHFRDKGWWKDTVEKESRRRDTHSERWTIAKALREVQSELAIMREELDGLKLLVQVQPEVFKQSPPAPQCPIDTMVKVSKEFFGVVKQTTVDNLDPIAELLPKP